MSPRDRPRQRHDLVLRLLDHQLVSPEGDLLGKVDDILLVGELPRLRATGLMVGPASLNRRLPGRLGRWSYAGWRRLRPDADPQPVVVPMTAVAGIGPAVELTQAAARDLAATFGLEIWLRRYLVGRLPGAGSAGDPGDEDLVGAAAARLNRDSAESASEVGSATAANGVLLSSLIGRPVMDEDSSSLGSVCEVRGEGRPAHQRQGEMAVTHLHITRHLSGSELGYGADPQQGPLLIGALVRRWQRSDILIPIGDVMDLGDADEPVTVRSGSERVHPHAAT